MFKGRDPSVFTTGKRSSIADRLREDSAMQKRGTADPAGVATLVVAIFSGAMSLAKAEQNIAPLRTCRQELVRLLA